MAPEGNPDVREGMNTGNSKSVSKQKTLCFLTVADLRGKPLSNGKNKTLHWGLQRLWKCKIRQSGTRNGRAGTWK